MNPGACSNSSRRSCSWPAEGDDKTGGCECISFIEFDRRASGQLPPSMPNRARAGPRPALTAAPRLPNPRSGEASAAPEADVSERARGFDFVRRHAWGLGILAVLVLLV